MTWTILRQRAGSVLLLPTLVLGASLLGGCGALDVSDPTLIEGTEINNSTGADLMRKGALKELALTVSQGVLTSGMLADEFLWDPNPNSANPSVAVETALDRRASLRFEELRPSGSLDTYAGWHAVRLAATLALPRLRTYMPEPPRSAYVGQMLAVRGFAALHLAEHYCPGFPLTDVIDDKSVSGPQRTTAEVFEQALADFDSALVYAADSTRFLDLARVGRARTLLGLGRFAEAAAAVAPVPTAYVWHAEFGNGPAHQLRFTWFATSSRRSVADREGGTGLDYVAANDPRVGTTLLGLAYDGVTEIRAMAKYPTTTAPIVVASGLEARLIEAEAALAAGGDWLGILNQLRATQVSPAMAVLTDPGTAQGRVDLLFRERAFWLFATGHRLGDLRRLVQHYDRAPETVFPTGGYRLGGVYESGTSIPFPAALEAAYNPAVTGCTSR